MQLFKKSDVDIATISVLLEILLFSVVYFIIGFLFNKQDPLMLSSEINFLLILLCTITLYYGLNSGLILTLLSAVVFYIYYKPFPFIPFVQNLIFVLICGEFHFFYRRSIRKLKEENSFLISKFDQLRNSFYLLKLSHDQLEKSFLLKPVSLRSIILDIRNMAMWDEDEASNKLLTLISKNFGVMDAAIFIKKERGFVKVASVGEEFELNRFNMLFTKAVEEKRSTYISEEFEDLRNYEYIAVIPAVNCEETTVAYLVIKEMKFLYYNRETMLTISIIMSLYADILTHKEVTEKLNSVAGMLIFEPDFNYELLRLYRLKEKFNIDSCYVVFKYNPKLNIEKSTLFQFIKDNIRAVDLSNEFGDVIVVLLPLIPYDGAKAFQMRINNLITNKLKIDPTLLEEKIILLTNYSKDIDTIKEYAS